MQKNVETSNSNLISLCLQKQHDVGVTLQNKSGKITKCSNVLNFLRIQPRLVGKRTSLFNQNAQIIYKLCFLYEINNWISK
jgi:hypothetical protein